jgi:hypothetical protein
MYAVYKGETFVREFPQRWQAVQLADRIGARIVYRPSN